MKRNYTKLFFVLILLVAFFVRFYNLGSIPVSLYWDETAMLVDAKTIATNGMDMHGNTWFQAMFPSYGDYKLPVYIWFAALSVKLVGVSEFALRLPSAIAGMGTVLVTGAILHQLLKLFKKDTILEKIPLSWATLAGCLLMTITPWSILFSRTGFEGHLAQLFVSLSVLSILHSRQRKWLLIPAVLLGSLATYTYFSVRFVWPIVFIATYLLLFPKISKQTNKKKIITSILLNFLILAFSIGMYLVSLQPMFNSPLYEDSNRFRLSTTSVLNAQDYPTQSNILRELAGNTLLDKFIFHRHVFLVRELAKNYADNLDFSYLFLIGDPNLRHGTGEHGLLLFPTAALLFWGIYLLGKEKPQVLLFLGVWWLVGLLPASVPESTPHALRSLNALVPVVLLASFGLLDLIQTLSKKTNKSTQAILASFLVGLAISSFSFTYYYFNIYPINSAFEWQDSYKQLAFHILERKDDVRTVYVNRFDDRFYLWLLAYGPFDAATIQDIPTEGYKVNQIENIIFENFDWKSTENLGYKVLIAVPKKSISSKLKDTPKQPDDLQEIVGYDKQTRFTVASYE